jgi:hypothetical protein
VEIAYHRPAFQVDELKKKLRVRSAKTLGERTFDIVYSLQTESDE